MKPSYLTNLLNQAHEARAIYDYAQAIQRYTAVLDESDGNTEDLDFVDMRLEALKQRGFLQRRMGKQEAAMASYRQYRQEARSDQQKVVGTELVAQQYSNMAQHDKAMSLHREALQLTETINYAYGRALVLQGMGSTVFFLGRYEEAISYIEKSLSLFRQIDDADEMYRTWNWLGLMHARQGSLDKSIAAFEKAKTLAEQLGDMELGIILSNLGESYQQLFDMEQALTYHRDALALVEKMNMPYMEVDTRRNMGVELCYLGQIDEGITDLRHSLQLGEVVGRPFLTYQVLYSLALAEHTRGKFGKAEEYAQRLFNLAEESGARDFQAQALHVLGLCAQAKDDALMAEQLWQQALFLAHETNQQTLLWQLHAALAEISPNEALSQTHYRIAAEVIEQIVYPIEDELLRQKFLAAKPVKAILDNVVI